MNDYLKQFTNHSAYSNAEQSLNRPCVSLCVQEGDLHYRKSINYNGHAYVDFGLPSGLKWATVSAMATDDWGGDWRLPTKQEIEELLSNTNAIANWDSSTREYICIISDTEDSSKQIIGRMLQSSSMHGPMCYGYYISSTDDEQDSTKVYCISGGWYEGNGRVSLDKINKSESGLRVIYVID